MRVEVVYSPAARRVEATCVDLPDGATVEAALRRTGWWPAGPLPGELSYSVWGRTRPLDQALRDGDRVEVCRGLKVDPKEARRSRAQARSRRRG